jgi:hypothetical protein
MYKKKLKVIDLRKKDMNQGPIYTHPTEKVHDAYYIKPVGDDERESQQEKNPYKKGTFPLSEKDRGLKAKLAQHILENFLENNSEKSLLKLAITLMQNKGIDKVLTLLLGMQKQKLFQVFPKMNLVEQNPLIDFFLKKADTELCQLWLQGKETNNAHEYDLSATYLYKGTYVSASFPQMLLHQNRDNELKE